jgi:hypothetical protein
MLTPMMPLCPLDGYVTVPCQPNGWRMNMRMRAMRRMVMMMGNGNNGQDRGAKLDAVAPIHINS